MNLLLVGVPVRLLQRTIDCPLIPYQGAWLLDLDDQVLDTEPGQHQVSITDLVVHLRKMPVQDHREQVLENVLCHLFGGRAESPLLREPFFPLCRNPGQAAVSRSQQRRQEASDTTVTHLAS